MMMGGTANLSKQISSNKIHNETETNSIGRYAHYSELTSLSHMHILYQLFLVLYIIHLNNLGFLVVRGKR